MNGFARAPRWIAASHRFWLGLILIGAGGLSFETVEAAPIRKDHLSGETHEAALSIAHHNWAAYLAGGPSVWAHVVHPPVTQAVESAIWKAIRTDPGETSPWIQFLVYKQELDPARFARFHPKLAPALARLSAPKTGPQAVSPPPTSPPAGGTSPPLTQGQGITAPTVPEPTTWLLALGMAGWAAWWRRRQNGQARIARAGGATGAEAP